MNDSIKPKERLYYIDWIRLLLIVLVVAHHAAQAYGPTGGAWPIYDVERTQLLGPFFGVNAAFFMGFFFMISGYFIPDSLERKGLRRFLIDRLIRLGIPLLLVGFGIFALIGYGDLEGDQSFWSYYINTYIGDWQVDYGPLWFVFHLLVYSFIYAILSKFGPKLNWRGFSGVVGHKALISLTVFIAVTVGLVRLFYPINVWVDVANIIPAELAHLPQYLTLFVVGTVAGRKGGFEALPRSVGYLWLKIGLLAAVLWYLRGYLASYAGIHLFSPDVLYMLYPVWESIICVGLCTGLIAYGRDHWNKSFVWLNSWSGASYGVYVFHVFTVVGLNMALFDLAWPPFIKFLIVTVLTVGISFLQMILLRKIPAVARVF